MTVMSLSAAIVLFGLSYITSTLDTHSTASENICPSWDSNLPNLCYEYGFCSSCVANNSSGCVWCELTNRCVSANSDCAVHDMFGLTTLDQCTAEYINDNRERPDIATTSYSPQLSESMIIYSFYSYKVDDTDLKFDTFTNTYDTFTLKNDSIQTFYAELTTTTDFSCASRAADDFTSDWLNLDVDDWIQEINEFIGFPSFHEVVHWIVDIGLSTELDEIATVLINKGIDITSFQFDVDITEIMTELFSNMGQERVVIALDDVHEAIVVSFRGTEAITTWLGYARFCMVNWDKSSLSQLKTDYDVSLDVQLMEVFSNAYDSLKDEFYSYVQQLIEQYPDYDLFITGHSLGGALANIFVLDLFADYYNDNSALDPSKIKVYTYGQPRVGNDGFASIVNQILDYEYYRVVFSKDPIPVLPPWAWGYRQAGIEIHYGEGDYSNGTLCQYRECTFLDPYEDTSCRARYNDVDWNDIGSIIEHILKAHFDLINGATNALFTWEEYDITGSVWYYVLDDTIDSVLNDHCGYFSLGKVGHCGTFETSENTVKSTDRTSFREIETDNYRCAAPFGQLASAVTNTISTIFDGGGALDNLNGCGNAGDDMLCCLGTMRSDTVCVESEGAELVCPQTNIGEHCLASTDCQDTLLNEVICVDGICEDQGADLGDSCLVTTDCSGWNLLGSGVDCCGFRCKQKQENYAGLFLCPYLCRKKWYSWFGTCDYEYDGTCESFSVNSDDCSETEDGWNLAIALGDSQYANTDSRIMFSYCINRVCSDWYYLNHCDHDDFEGSCSYQYFIVPNMTEVITAALESADVAIDFEFATCGSKSSDGVQIDQIGIGHKASLINIHTFVHEDDAFCRFSGTDEGSFAIDSDRCASVSLSYNLGTTSSIIYSGLISTRCYDEICDYDNKPDCASESSRCEANGISQANVGIVNNPEVNVVMFEISNGMLWILSGFVVILLLISMNNLQKCRRNKNIQYHSVNVESSSEDC